MVNAILKILWALPLCAKTLQKTFHKHQNLMKKFIIPSVAISFFSAALFFSPLATAENDPHSAEHNFGNFGSKLFSRMDTSDDGAVSKEELIAHHKKIFDSVDDDHDGKITRYEARLKEREKSFNQHGEKAQKGYLTFDETLAVEITRFEAADYNHDGKVTRKEYKKHYLASFAKDQKQKVALN